MAMWVESLFIEICSPQNRQRAVPGEMWTRCIFFSMHGARRGGQDAESDHLRHPNIVRGVVRHKTATD